MPQTWLDGFIELTGSIIRGKRSAAVPGGKVHFKGIAPDFKNNLDAAKFVIKTLLTTKVGLSSRHELIISMQAVAVSFFLLADEWTNEGTETKPLALQLTAELAADFRNCKAPDVDDWRKVIQQHECIYIDVPFGTYFLDVEDEPAYLRAIFLIQRPGIDKEPIVLVSYASKDSISMDDHGELLFLWDAPVYKPGPEGVIESELKDIIKLAILYHLTEPERAKPLPLVSRTRFRKESERGKGAEVLEKFSLFHIVRLHTPHDRFGREDEREAKPKEGYKIGVRYERAGQFVWQAYGERWSKNRLRWRSGSICGPKDAPLRHPIHRLEAN